MTERHSVTLRLTPPSRLERIWHRRLGTPAPEASASSGPRSAELARLVPYRWRTFHWCYAVTHGYYWLPCILCDRHHGGHEGGEVVPDPTAGPGRGIVICSDCTRARNREAT